MQVIFALNGVHGCAGSFTMIQKDVLPLQEELVISAAQFIQPVVLFLTPMWWRKNKTFQENLSLWEGE